TRKSFPVVPLKGNSDFLGHALLSAASVDVEDGRSCHSIIVRRRARDRRWRANEAAARVPAMQSFEVGHTNLRSAVLAEDVLALVDDTGRLVLATIAGVAA